MNFTSLDCEPSDSEVVCHGKRNRQERTIKVDDVVLEGIPIGDRSIRSQRKPMVCSYKINRELNHILDCRID